MTRSEKDEGKRFSSRFWRIFVLFLYYLGAWRRSRPPSDYTRWHAFLVRTYTQHICSTRRHYADPFLPMTEQLIARTVSGIYASKTKEKDIGEKSIVVLSTFFKMGGKKRVWQQSNWLEDTRLWLMLVCEEEGNKRSPPTHTHLQFLEYRRVTRVAAFTRVKPIYIALMCVHPRQIHSA